MSPRSPLSEFTNLAAISRALGCSYSHAWTLSAAGKFGEPLVVGRSYWYERSVVDKALAAMKESHAGAAA